MRPLMMATVCLTLGLSLPAHAETAPPSPTQLPPELQVPCPAVEDVSKWLKKDFGEEPADLGLVHPASEYGGSVLMLYRNEAVGTWTLMSVTPKGCTGLVAFGIGWGPATLPGQPA